MKNKNINFSNDILVDDVEIHNEKKFINDSPEVRDYYKKLRDKIIHLYESNRKQEAIDILWEELQQPYLPSSVEQDFYDLYNSYSLVVREESSKINWDIITKNEIYDRILNPKNGNLNIYFLNLYLTHLKEQQKEGQMLMIDNEDSIFFQFILTHPYIINIDKYNFLIELKIAGVNKELKFINNNLNHFECIINPTTIILPENNNSIKEIAKFLEQKDFKNPVILNHELEILNLLYIYVFPRQDIGNIDNITNAIYSYVHAIIDGTEYDHDDPIIQIIETELTKIIDNDNNPYSF